MFHGNHKVGGNRQEITMNNCVSMQTFLDIKMSVHFVVLLIVQFRDNFPTLPIPLLLQSQIVASKFCLKWVV